VNCGKRVPQLVTEERQEFVLLPRFVCAILF
jgi:hypothetical protein